MTFDAEHKKSSQAIRSLRRRGTGGGARPAVRGRPPRVAKRSQRFAKSPRVRAPKARNKQHPRWGRCLFGTGGATPGIIINPISGSSQSVLKSNVPSGFASSSVQTLILSLPTSTRTTTLRRAGISFAATLRSSRSLSSGIVVP